ncbi:MAG TPA: hypothetical protein VG722_09665, partial [Tepidisphaeraceae bacterium]|nr:hypothetical protein [Tepidisphaeraceae bacterium]
ECVTAYEPLSFSNKATDSQIRLAELSREIFASFIAADFERCLQWLALAEKEFGSSKFFALYARQCHQNLKAAPPDFDGRIVLEEK